MGWGLACFGAPKAVEPFDAHEGLDLESLRTHGYAVLKGGSSGGCPDPAPLLAAMARYFASPADDKARDALPEALEQGYRTVGNGKEIYKEMYFVRRRPLPAALAAASPFWQACHALALRYLDAVAADTGLHPSALRALVEPPRGKEAGVLPLASRSDSLLRLFHYRPREGDGQGGGAEPLALQAGPHTDDGLLAIGVRSAPGLEVWLGEEVGWGDVELGLAPSDVVVMSGDTLALATRGRYPPALHRVRAGGTPRLAAIYHLRIHREARMTLSGAEVAYLVGRFKRSVNRTAPPAAAG